MKPVKVFKNSWTDDFFFIEKSSGAFCLLCPSNQKLFTLFTTDNFKRHAQKNHRKETDLCADERKTLVITLLNRSECVRSQQQQQQQKNQQQLELNENIIRVSYIVAYKLAKSLKSFEDGAFLKSLLLEIVSILCPKEKENFEKIPISPSTIQRRVVAISEKLKEQMQMMINQADYYSIAMDESTDIGDFAQLGIYVRAINDDFEILEEIGSLNTMDGRVNGETLVAEFDNSINVLQILKWISKRLRALQWMAAQA